MKNIRPAIFVILLAVSAGAWAADAAAPTQVLPSQFGGWQLKEPAAKSADPSVADETNASVLKEYGFQRLEKTTYTRGDGRKLVVKAAVFTDASGAYGAFTYYKNPAMRDETIGGQAASVNNRVVFYQGNILVDAIFDRLTTMSAAELRELAGVLPVPAGNARNLPPLPNYLPKQVDAKNAKYVLGPAGLDHVGSPLPSAMVDFKAGAEVVIAKHEAKLGDATLMLIEYPTPQLAAEKLRELDAAHQPTQQGSAGSPSVLDVAPFFDKRTGPIIVIAAGPLALSEARALLGSVSYEADVTWNENTYVSKKDNLANLLFNIIVLCGIVVGVSLVAGVAFGGFRIVMKRLFPDRVFDRPEDRELISLHLGDTLEQASRRR
ncbi:MAG: hypothetical protein HY010_20745 [Acidobacteria bacterium]|nr:hypothetical protein [Acidobacteriota bacterium]